MGTIDRDRFYGALIGLAVGDAVGTTLEFVPPERVKPIDDMVGGGPFNLPAGCWTDDTSMALCLADSLLASGGHDPADQMDRYWRWYKEGYRSSTGRCFDIGMTVRQALMDYQKTGNPNAGSSDPFSAGNGSLMRLAPVPLFFANESFEKVLELAVQSSRPTHGAATCFDACRYLAGLILGALNGVGKEQVLAPRFTLQEGYWEMNPFQTEAIESVASGSFWRNQPPQIQGTGYVVKSLEAALWAFATTSDFRSGCLAAANLGDDADTTAAIYGQLAGAHYGLSGIPTEWVEKLAQREELLSVAGLLWDRFSTRS